MSEAVEVSGDGRSRRWEQHRAQRRAELTHAARRAIHHGGADLSMDEIAGAIGTSKSIVYRYFTDRTGLQTAIGEAVLVDLGDALATATSGARDPHDVIASMVRVYLEMISHSPSVYAFVTRGEAEAGGGPMRTLADDAAALLVPVLAEVLGASGRPPALADTWAGGVIGFVRGAAEVWVQQTSDDADSRAGALEDLTDTLTEWVCHGTSPTPAASPSSPYPADRLTDHRGR